jgi:hypothetical protein
MCAKVMFLNSNKGSEIIEEEELFTMTAGKFTA